MKMSRKVCRDSWEMIDVEPSDCPNFDKNNNQPTSCELANYVCPSSILNLKS